MARKKRNTDKSDLHVSDFGNIEIPDLDLSLFDVLNDGYDEHFSRIVEKYATIRKPIRGTSLWSELVKKRFND